MLESYSTILWFCVMGSVAPLFNSLFLFKWCYIDLCKFTEHMKLWINARSSSENTGSWFFLVFKLRGSQDWRPSRMPSRLQPMRRKRRLERRTMSQWLKSIRNWRTRLTMIPMTSDCFFHYYFFLLNFISPLISILIMLYSHLFCDMLIYNAQILGVFLLNGFCGEQIPNG